MCVVVVAVVVPAVVGSVVGSRADDAYHRLWSRRPEDWDRIVKVVVGMDHHCSYYYQVR